MAEAVAAKAGTGGAKATSPQSDEWIGIQKNTFTAWVNTQVRRAHRVLEWLSLPTADHRPHRLSTRMSASPGWRLESWSGLGKRRVCS